MLIDFDASMTRSMSSREISRCLPVTETTPRELTGADVIAGHADVDRFDLQAGHDLSLVDGFLHRLDGLVEIDDVAAPRALHRRGALADDLNLAAVGHFPYQHTHLGSPDIERDDVFLFGLRHSLSPD